MVRVAPFLTHGVRTTSAIFEKVIILITIVLSNSLVQSTVTVKSKSLISLHQNETFLSDRIALNYCMQLRHSLARYCFHHRLSVCLFANRMENRYIMDRRC